MPTFKIDSLSSRTAFQGSNINLSNGSATIYSASLGAASLTASKPIKTNSVKQLISTNLDITDVNTLQTQLNEKSELSFIKSDTHTTPSSGNVKIYTKTDGEFYKKNDLGEESPLAPEGYNLIPIPTETILNITDIDYKSDIEKTTWSDTSLNKYNYYNYYSSPKKPNLRTPYVPLDSRATIVSNEGDLDQAITDQKDDIFITTDFNITSSKDIAFPCKIYGDSLSKPTITGVDITTSLFNVSSDNVFFQNLILTNDNTSSNTNCIFFGFNNDAANNCVHDCVFNTNEFAITSSHYQVQIYNNVFQFIGTPDSHRYISLNRCIGEVLIYNNVFHSNGLLSSTACLLINSSNGSTDFDGGHLVLYSNSSSSGSIWRMAIMETDPVNFKLSLIENTIETYTDFFILYGDTMLNGFNEIIAYKNTVTLLPESPGFKGLIGWDTPGTGGDITYSPVIRASLNVLPNTLRPDYSPLPNSTNDNPIVCFKNTKFTTSLQVLINPLLVGQSVDPRTQNITATPGVTTFTGTIGSDNVKATTEVAIGNDAGLTSQLAYSVAIGDQAGKNGQGTYNIAIGKDAGTESQTSKCVAIGRLAGNTDQQNNSVAIGWAAGESKQSRDSVAMGTYAGRTTQGEFSVAVGADAGSNQQGNFSIAIGYQSGVNTQGVSSIAIGNNAGVNSQGANSIAIGNNAGVNSQANDSIILNASNVELNASSSGLYIAPIVAGTTPYRLCYDPTTHQITYTSS